jgi:hypothetical protein
LICELLWGIFSLKSRDKSKLAHLHFDEKKYGERSGEVRKASFGGVRGKETIWLARIKGILEAVASEILRGKKNREKALGILD